MKVMGVRELKAHMSEVLDEVDKGNVIQVTKNGRTIARIVPVGQQVGIEERRAIIANMDRAAEEISRYAPQGTNAAEILSDMRR